MDYFNGLLIRLSDSADMTPWEVIDEALSRKRPRRNMTWLAEQLGENLQTVSNWKKRGVPARRFREIGKALGLTVDQIEGHEPPPWETEPEAGLLPDVAQLAQAINELPELQRKAVIEMATLAISLVAEQALSTSVVAPAPERRESASPERPRKLR